MGKEENSEENIMQRVLKHSFHVISLTLLSLLHPLSFLLLARLNSHLLSFTSISIILYTLVLSVSLSSLFSSISGYAITLKLPTSIAWIFLCLYQACITFGIEATLKEGFKPLENTDDANSETWLKRSFLFVGLYDQMILWKRKLVKPVVDDTIYKEEKKEGGAGRVITAVSFAALWLWLLQREMHPLVLATGKGGLRKAVGWSGFLIWLVSFATTMAGFVRAIELLVWLVSIILQFMHRRKEQEDGLTPGANDV